MVATRSTSISRAGRPAATKRERSRTRRCTRAAADKIPYRRRGTTGAIAEPTAAAIPAAVEETRDWLTRTITAMVAAIGTVTTATTTTGTITTTVAGTDTTIIITTTGTTDSGGSGCGASARGGAAGA